MVCEVKGFDFIREGGDSAHYYLIALILKMRAKLLMEKKSMRASC